MKPRFGTALFLSASLLILVSGRAAFSDPPKERYVFVENTDRWVGVMRSGWYVIGKLDLNGDFLDERKIMAGRPWISAPPHSLLTGGAKPKKVYEFRSGMLIPGEVQPDGRFVPEAGGKIIRFKEYQYSPAAIPIWNLPGVFVTEEEAARLKKTIPEGKH